MKTGIGFSCRSGRVVRLSIGIYSWTGHTNRRVASDSIMRSGPTSTLHHYACGCVCHRPTCDCPMNLASSGYPPPGGTTSGIPRSLKLVDNGKRNGDPVGYARAQGCSRDLHGHRQRNRESGIGSTTVIPGSRQLLDGEG